MVATEPAKKPGSVESRNATKRGLYESETVLKREMGESKDAEGEAKWPSRTLSRCGYRGERYFVPIGC